MPIQKYVTFCLGMGDLKRSVDNKFISIRELRKHFDLLHSICITNLETLRDNILHQLLHPDSSFNPMAKTKYEALAWCYKHEMWHCAEMEHLKIALGFQTNWI